MSLSLPDAVIAPVVCAALAEDLGERGDVTSQATIDETARFAAVFAARHEGRIAGLDCARLAIRELDPEATFEIVTPDGADAAPGAILARVEGNARALISAERVALNLLGRLSGIATLTRAYVRAVEGTKARITDTRKTTPNLRALEKYAVTCGGGVNHRMGLFDAVLIKDNHVAACGSVGEAVRRARALVGETMTVEIEIDGLHQLAEALAEAPDVIMLDNFSLADMRTAVAEVAGRAVLEASGGVTLETVRPIAETGVDVISVGALTHSAPVLDVGLDAA
ncbi:MAG TPA: carboxylating nicotinate-nucleotide diphosphorylase [Caulobacteraceae bacterium]